VAVVGVNIGILFYLMEDIAGVGYINKIFQGPLSRKKEKGRRKEGGRESREREGVMEGSGKDGDICEGDVERSRLGSDMDHTKPSHIYGGRSLVE
jgi:hypothetical protein